MERRWTEPSEVSLKWRHLTGPFRIRAPDVAVEFDLAAVAASQHQQSINTRCIYHRETPEMVTSLRVTR